MHGYCEYFVIYLRGSVLCPLGLKENSGRYVSYITSYLTISISLASLPHPIG